MPEKQVPAEVSQLFQRISRRDSNKAATAARKEEVEQQSLVLSRRIKGIGNTYGKEGVTYVPLSSGGGRMGMNLIQAHYFQTPWVEIPGEEREVSIIGGEGYRVGYERAEQILFRKKGAREERPMLTFYGWNIVDWEGKQVEDLAPITKFTDLIETLLIEQGPEETTQQ